MIAARYLAYRDCKESGVAWFGNIPSHWRVAPFKRSIDRNDGGVWGADPLGDNDTIVLRSTEQTVDGKWELSDPASRHLSEDEINKALLKEGDLLLTKSSGSSLHIGKTTLVTNEIASLKCCYSNFMQRIRLNENILPKLAWYIINNELARVQLDFLSNSTTGLANLNGTMIGDILLPVSPVAEQMNIANFLDHETAKIDTLIDKQQQLIKLLKEKRQAVISHAVTKGLNPAAPMKDSGVEWLGEVPEHWVTSRVKFVAKLESGHTPDKKIDAYWADCNIPWVSLNDSQTLKEVDYIFDTKFKVNTLGIENSSARLLPKRCVVFTRDASIGLAAITTCEMAVSQHLIAWVCNKQMIFPEYLLLVFYAMEGELERYTYGATIKTIGMPDVKKLTCAHPNLPEQQEIAKHVFEKKQSIDMAIQKVERSINLLQERRTALISAAVTGKIDVRNWQPAQPKIPMEASV